MQNTAQYGEAVRGRMLAIGKLHKHSDKAFEQGEEKPKADV